VPDDINDSLTLRFEEVTMVRFKNVAPTLALILLPSVTDAAEPYHEFGYVRMEDGARLAYSLHLPQEHGRFPVLIRYHPYIGGGMVIERGVPGAGATAEFLRNGYASLTVGMRGTGCSSGEFTLLSDEHGQDGAELVEWAATQPWSTGKVGLWGNSFSGMAPYLAGAQQPPHLAAMAVGAASGDGYRDTIYPGGMFNAAQFAQWTFTKQPWISTLSIENRLAAGDEECREFAAGRGPTRTYEWVASHPLRDEWWEGQSLVRRAENTVAPTMVVNGWQDQQIGSLAALDLYRALQGPKRLLVGNGPHGFYNTPPVLAEILRWFDHWLKGETNGVDTEPAVTVLFEAAARGGEPGWRQSFDDWPPDVEEEVLYLTAEDNLVFEREQLDPESGTSWYLSPSATELVFDTEVFSRVPGTWGALTYRSQPLVDDLVVLGRPVVVLELESTRLDTDLMVVLHDVYPDGRTLFVQRGFLRASHRALDEERSTTFDPVLQHDHEVQLAPGRVHELTIGLLPVGHAFRAGHRLELVITAPPPVHIAVDHWGFDGLHGAAINTVHHSPDHPSRLLLPRLPGARAQSPEPDCSALAAQPCRAADARPPQTIVTAGRRTAR
jgi:putative CocE/NonD family hydrolase